MGDLAELTGRDRVQALEDYIKLCPQVDFPIEERFAGGMYARIMFAPAGTVFTGKIHLTQHFAMLAAGVMEISDGVKHGEYEAPSLFTSEPGDKRAGVAKTDCIFITFHNMNGVDPDNIEKYLVVDTQQEYDDYLKSLENGRED